MSVEFSKLTYIDKNGGKTKINIYYYLVRKGEADHGFVLIFMKGVLDR